eukprot:CAMPEP_0119348982 /NCGR_PEP_ID=MMETSP1333-20130426/109321_1 /TAXON_ID=418940 /ORGANISM="Scyphosphaera apsteinii, Strain RCC1455" /LENGTH=44 /DNA_ID= /DNA_START= /DNA_END= /DNA_ORIENTATION=
MTLNWPRDSLALTALAADAYLEGGARGAYSGCGNAFIVVVEERR